MWGSETPWTPGTLCTTTIKIIILFLETSDNVTKHQLKIHHLYTSHRHLVTKKIYNVEYTEMNSRKQRYITSLPSFERANTTHARGHRTIYNSTAHVPFWHWRVRWIVKNRQMRRSDTNPAIIVKNYLPLIYCYCHGGATPRVAMNCLDITQ